MDMKLSCLIKGSVAIIFGLLALVLPGQVVGTFTALFWVFIIAGIAIFLFLATTSRADESMFWFGLSAVFVVVGVVSVLIQGIVAIIFLILVAGIAFYSGFSDVIYALEHPKTKYVLISGMFLVGALLLAVLIRFYPVSIAPERIILTILGTFALIFGMFSVLIGVYPVAETVEAVVAEKPKKARFQPVKTRPQGDQASDPSKPPCECAVCNPDEKE